MKPFTQKTMSKYYDIKEITDMNFDFFINSMQNIKQVLFWNMESNTDCNVQRLIVIPQELKICVVFWYYIFLLHPGLNRFSTFLLTWQKIIRLEGCQ